MRVSMETRRSRSSRRGLELLHPNEFERLEGIDDGRAREVAWFVDVHVHVHVHVHDPLTNFGRAVLVSCWAAFVRQPRSIEFALLAAEV